MGIIWKLKIFSLYLQQTKILNDMRYKQGFKFKPVFGGSNIDFFEVRGIDKERDMVLTVVHTKTGSTFNDEIEKEYYDAAFIIGDYVAIA